MVDPDPERRREGIRHMETRIAACKSLGASVIATCTGSRHPDGMRLPVPVRGTLEAVASEARPLETGRERP